jgi:subtilisin family serine protease
MRLASRDGNASARSRTLVTFGLMSILTSVGCRDAVAPASLTRPDTRLSSTGAAPDSTPAVPHAIPGDYIVVFKQDVQDAPGLARQLVTDHGGVLHFTYSTVLSGFAAHLSDRAVEALENNPFVERVDPDLVATATSVEPAPSWGLDRVDQRGLPLNSQYTYAASGAGVNVYILDTGIRTTHVEFGGRASGAFTAIDDGNGTNDCDGHGTHVAGTVGGSVYGVAKAVNLYAVRVLDCTGSGAWSGVIAGLDWIAKNHVSPAVANMSFGGEFVQAVNDAVANTVASGVTVVVSAGNSAADACNFSPSSAQAALTVGAANWNDYQSTFSNFGPCLDLYAPGEGITSSWYSGDSATLMLSGTSMAAPHVTGAAALYLEANPGATPANVAAGVVGGATSGALTKLARTSPNLLLYTGSLSSPWTSPPTLSQPVASFATSCQKGNCTFNGSASTDDTGIVSYAWSFGDSTSLTTTSPSTSHSYFAKGNYSVTVKLTVTDAGGLTGFTQKTLNIKNNGR